MRAMTAKTVETEHAARLLDLPHLLVQIESRVPERLNLIGWAADLVVFVKNSDGNGLLTVAIFSLAPAI